MNMLQRFPDSPALDHEFDWYNDPDVIVTQQDPIAVHCNPLGQIVIRQKTGQDDGSDSLIILNPSLASTLARALLSAANEAFPEADARDHTAAERQRRYRQRHRNGVTTVTPRHAKKREDQLI